jgi:hypothetical protein
MTAAARRRPATIPALHAAIKEKRFDDALKLARDGLRDTAESSEIWNALGVALRATGHPEAALGCYRRALELAPADLAALGNLGNALKDLQRHAEAIATHRRVVGSAPSSNSWTNLGVACHEAALLHDALAAFDEAVRLDPENASAQFDRAQVLLRLGRYAEGWSAFEWRWKLPDRPPMPRYATPLWDGKPLDGALLVWPEQGFGDSILSMRFLPALRRRVKRIVLGCKPELMRLFQNVAGVDELVPIGKPAPPHAAHAPVMGLARHVMTSLATLPPPPRLTPPREARAKLAALIARSGKRLKIGIVWSGSVTFRANAQRATGLERFLGFAEIPGVQLFSLQKGPRAEELAGAGAADLVIDLAPHLEDFADTAAALELLDLVIMTDSSVAHLAGSLDRPIWNLLPYSAYWLYLEGRSDSPWYPSMRLFRQPRPGDWEAVFAQARSALAELAMRHAAPR